MNREELCELWPMLDGPLSLLEQWDGPRGIIFESDPSSAFEAVSAVASMLGGHVEKFERHPVLKEDWEERAGRFIAGKVPPGALYEAKRDRLVVVLMDLERQPEWLQLKAKAPMDRASKPGCDVRVLATSDDAAKIPDYVRSHFHVVRKTGRRRGAAT